jgi:hypothetical protein
VGKDPSARSTVSLAMLKHEVTDSSRRSYETSLGSGSAEALMTTLQAYQVFAPRILCSSLTSVLS